MGSSRRSVRTQSSLLFVFRRKLGFTGTKVGCERGECGACTVLVDRVPHCTCMMLALEAEILIPKSPPGLRTSYRKVRVREAWDFAVAGVALALVFKGDRVERGGVVLSGAAPIPWRSRAVEQVVSGGKLDAEAAEGSAEAAVKGAEPLAQNGCKIPLFRSIVVDELTRLARL